MEKDSRDAIIIGLTLIGVMVGAYLIIKILKAGSLTDITRDSDGRITSIIEKPLK